MKKFERSEELLERLFIDAFDRHVIMDAKVQIVQDPTNHRKLRAFCPSTGTYLNFPYALRQYVGQEYIADVIKASNASGAIFYRAYRKTIRNKEGDVVG